MTRYERWEVHDAESVCHIRCSYRERAEQFVADYTASVVRAGGSPLTLRIVHLVETPNLIGYREAEDRLKRCADIFARERAVIEAAKAWFAWDPTTPGVDRTRELEDAIRRLVCDEGLRIGAGG